MPLNALASAYPGVCCRRDWQHRPARGEAAVRERLQSPGGRQGMSFATAQSVVLHSRDVCDATAASESFNNMLLTFAGPEESGQALRRRQQYQGRHLQPF